MHHLGLADMVVSSIELLILGAHVLPYKFYVSLILPIRRDPICSRGQLSLAKGLFFINRYIVEAILVYVLLLGLFIRETPPGTVL